MFLRTLGGLELEGAGIQRRKLLLLVCHLALDGPQDRAHLAELFWRHSADPRNQLSVSLSLLRKNAPGVVDADPSQVGCNVPTDVGALQEALDRGDFERALRLYRGPFLAGVHFGSLGEELEEWIHTKREHLARRIQSVHVLLAERTAAEGGFERAAKRAELAYGLRGADAPEPDLLGRLHTLMLAGGSVRAAELRRDAEVFDLPLASTAEGARRRLVAPAAPRALPTRGTSFVGRTPERRDLAEILLRADRRLVTLIGMGGAGKTRLAIQVALEGLEADVFPDGVHFVALDALSSPASIPASIAAALELPLQGSADPLQQVIDHMADKRVLLVLDNYEQVVDGAVLAATLLRSCPSLKLLVTSRERLDLEEEWLFPVRGMPFPRGAIEPEEARDWDAVTLFVDRAERTRPGFRPAGDELRHVTEICRLVEGNPLAIELASAWVGVMPLEEIASGIANGLDLLETTTRNVPDRHRNLRGVLEQSWGRLTDEERAGFARLSVFRGGFGREGALEVADASLSTLASLVAKSLLHMSPNGRYEIHPLLAQYAGEKLMSLPREPDQTRARHAAYILARAEETAEYVNELDGGSRMERFEADNANLVVALTWAEERGEDGILLQLCDASMDYWIRRGRHVEALEWLRKAIARTDGASNARLYAHGLVHLSYLYLLQGDPDTPRGLLEESLALYRQLGDRLGEARVLSHLGMRIVWQGDYATARAHYEDALEITRSLEGHEEMRGRLLNNLGDVLAFQGDPSAARTRYEESLALMRSLGNHQMMSNVLGSLGEIALDAGDTREAQRHLRESLRLVQVLGIRFSLPPALEQFAALALSVNRPLAAARLWGAAEALREAIHVRLQPYEQPWFDAWTARAREQVEATAFADAWDRGRQMPLEEAIELALSLQVE